MSFFSLLIFTRILGKQQISQMTFFDYVAGITIGSIAASMTVDVSVRAWPQFFRTLHLGRLGISPSSGSNEMAVGLKVHRRQTL